MFLLNIRNIVNTVMTITMTISVFMNMRKTCDINLKATKIMFISPERENHNLSSISCRGALTRVRASGVSVNREPVLGREEEDPPRKPCPKGVLLLKGGSSQISNGD